MRDADFCFKSPHRACPFSLGPRWHACCWLFFLMKMFSVHCFKSLGRFMILSDIFNLGHSIFPPNNYMILMIIINVCAFLQLEWRVVNLVVLIPIHFFNFLHLFVIFAIRMILKSSILFLIFWFFFNFLCFYNLFLILFFFIKFCKWFPSIVSYVHDVFDFKCFYFIKLFNIYYFQWTIINIFLHFCN